MAQFNPKQFIFCGTQNNIYNYDGELYTATFPQEWASSHAPKSGPVDCDNCRHYGSWNGVFIGYCINCANNPLYEGQRGRGMMSQGIELYKTISKNISMYDSYFKDADLEKVGDIWIDDTFKRVYSSTYNISIIHQSFNEWLFGSIVFYDENQKLRKRPEQIITFKQQMQLITDAMTPSQYKDEHGKHEEEYQQYKEETGLEGLFEDDDSPENCVMCNTEGRETYFCNYHKNCVISKLTLLPHYQIVRHDGFPINKFTV
jgi:hypothetical protein